MLEQPARHDHGAQQLLLAVDERVRRSIEQAHARRLRGQNLSLRLDVFNFGNLLNKNWGRQITTSNFNPVPIYTQSGSCSPGGSTTGATLANAVPEVTFDPNFNPFTYNNVLLELLDAVVRSATRSNQRMRRVSLDEDRRKRKRAWVIATQARFVCIC